MIEGAASVLAWIGLGAIIYGCWRGLFQILTAR